MIPATSIHFNDDGTAWVVGTKWWATVIMRDAQDRPCDTCDGRKWCLGDDTPGLYDAIACPDCGGTGRHTFTAEVATPESKGFGEFIDTLRVSVVPGMVLKIYVIPMPLGTTPVSDLAEMMTFIEATPQPFVGLMQISGTAVLVRHDRYEPITLSPDAKPGMWAVLLAVHS